MHSVNAVSHSHTHSRMHMHALSHTHMLVLISLLIMQPVSCSLRRGIWNELPQHPKGRGRWRERRRGRGGSGCYRTERGKASECSRLHSGCRVASRQRIGRGKEQEKQSPSSGVQWNESWSYQSLSAPDHLPRCSNLWLVLKPPGLLLLWLLLTHCCASDLLPLSLGASALSCRAHSSALIGDFDLGGYNIFDFCCRCTRSSKTENSRVWLPVSGEARDHDLGGAMSPGCMLLFVFGFVGGAVVINSAVLVSLSVLLLVHYSVSTGGLPALPSLPSLPRPSRYKICLFVLCELRSYVKSVIAATESLTPCSVAAMWVRLSDTIRLHSKSRSKEREGCEWHESYLD